MKLEIKGVKDNGVHDDERLVIDITENTDIGEYIVFDTTYTSEHEVSNKIRHPHWFADQKVNKGDTVVLYTKKGTNSQKKRDNGSVIYFHYWGLNSSIWNNDGDAAVVLHIDDWIAKKVK